MVINEFQGQYRFLSNFWPAQVILYGIDPSTNEEYEVGPFETVEAAYQAAKSHDEQYQLEVYAAKTPGDAKRLGRKAKLRSDWEEVKIGIMEDLVRQKFTNSFDLKQKLLATGDAELIEGNTWNDVFWGVCRGKGRNELGKILMKVRTELQSS